MKDYKYKTTFSSEIRPLIAEEKDKYLALASLSDIGSFVPDIDTEKEIDLLPVAFNAFVANRVNRNDDVIDTSTALEIYKSFINKPINIEHNRERVIGVILTAGFSEFGTDVPLKEEDIKEKNIPFNVTLGGVIWRVTNNELANLIEDSSDPSNESYLKISASWELGFSEYNLVVLDQDERNLENASFIKDEVKIEEMSQHLRSLGGSGKTEDDKKIYRLVVGEVIPLGIGLTETPAADVKGIVTEGTLKDQKMEQKATEVTKNEILEKSGELISQVNEKNVDIKHRNVMKIQKLSDITDESLKELSASAVNDFIQEELKKASDEYVADKNSGEKKLEAANEQYNSLVKEHDGILTELEKVKEGLSNLEQEKSARESLERFSRFMASLDEDYDLTEDDRKILAGDIKDMQSDAFDEYRQKMSILLDHKKKGKAEASEKEETVEVVASEQKPEQKPEQKLEEKVEEKAEEIKPEEVLDKVVAGEEQDIPNSQTAEEPSLMEKYRDAFSIDNFEVNVRKF